MTNPKDVLEDMARKRKKLDDPRAAAGDFSHAVDAGRSSRCSSEKLDDLGLCVEAPNESSGPAEAPKENKHRRGYSVSDYEDAIYRARCLILSARQNAAETRETLTAVVAQAATALAALTQLEHDLEDAHDWLALDNCPPVLPEEESE